MNLADGGKLPGMDVVSVERGSGSGWCASRKLEKWCPRRRHDGRAVASQNKLDAASRSPMEFIPSKGMKQYTAPDEPVEPADPSREAPRPSNRSQKQSQRSLYTTTSSQLSPTTPSSMPRSGGSLSKRSPPRTGGSRSPTSPSRSPPRSPPPEPPKGLNTKRTARGTARGWFPTTPSTHRAHSGRWPYLSFRDGYTARSQLTTNRTPKQRPPREGPPTDPSQSEVYGPDLSAAAVRCMNIFTIEAKDAMGERVLEGGDVFQISVRCNKQGVKARGAWPADAAPFTLFIFLSLTLFARTSLLACFTQHVSTTTRTARISSSSPHHPPAPTRSASPSSASRSSAALIHASPPHPKRSHGNAYCAVKGCAT